MEAVSSFPNISTQRANQRHERWINTQNRTQAISKQPRDGVTQ